MRSGFPIAVLAGAAAVPAAALAAATDTELLRCRAVPDVTARLTCYEALTPSAPAGTVLPPAAAAMPPPAAAAVARTPPSAAAPAVAAVAAPPPATTGPAAFGLESRARPVEAETSAVEDRVVGDFSGWRRGSRITLANGQVWEVIDDSRAVVDQKADTRVRISRAMLGSFLLEVVGRNASARVRRVQ